jgi:parallel beta-helix repeat protein
MDLTSATCWVTTNNGVTFTKVASFTGTNTNWTQATINLDAFAGHPSVRIVFQLLSDSTITQDGWYIDDVAVNGTLLGSNTGPMDVFMIVDLSGSFIDDLSNFKNQAADMIASLRAANPNIRFGLAKFEDYPIDPFGLSGDKAYQRLVDLTFDSNLVLNTIAGLSILNDSVGGDYPQSQLAALYQAVTGAGQSVAGFSSANIPAGQQASFRYGAKKLMLLWTDAPFHQPGDPGTIPYPGPSFDQTVNAILALDPPKVIGISSGSDGLADLQRIAAATGSLAPAGGVDCNGDGVIDILAGAPLACPIPSTGTGIGEAIVALVTAATTPSISINDVTVTEGNGGTVNAAFTVSLSAASGQTVTVNYSTANNTATGGASCMGGTDYISKSGMLTFTPGQTSQPINVAVCGETVPEANETFFVNLTSAINATIVDGQGVGTILNDDSPTVNCQSQSLQTALASAASGVTISVSGTCNENLLVDNNKIKVFLDGNGVATIHGTDSTKPALDIRGKAIFIGGFTITGGRDGIVVQRGSNVVLDGNVVQNTGGSGIVVNQLAFAILTNNTIQNNAEDGVIVADSASAHIGFNNDSETVASPNVIQGNGGNGITVQGSSSAQVVGNVIGGNGGDGVGVLRGSHADIAANSIDGNGGSGVYVDSNWVVNLGEDTGSTIYALPNSTSSSNARFGVECADGGMADGRRGSLSGGLGPTSFLSGCINDLTP